MERGQKRRRLSREMGNVYSVCVVVRSSVRPLVRPIDNANADGRTEQRLHNGGIPTIIRARSNNTAGGGGRLYVCGHKLNRTRKCYSLSLAVVVDPSSSHQPAP